MASALAALAVGALALVPFPAAGAGGPDDGDPAVGAVSFLNSQQAPDGGFGPGPLTPNAVSAIAQQAQTTTTWSAKEAIDAVSAVETDDGATPLDALDALAEDNPSADLAAQMISRAVLAMGLDPENFDPAGDGTPVDLVREVAGARREDGSYGSLTATAEAVLALVLVPAGVLLGQSGTERALLVGSVLLVLSIELLNSAIEAVIERYGPEHHELAGRAKDMGSAAVFVALLGVAATWALILWPAG